MNWTKDQLIAIEERKKNMLVSAAAGSGKTALLIERIVRMVTQEKVGVDELLVLTFTRSAAGEMKNRLSQALSKALDDCGKNRNFIMKQLNHLSGAKISTLHAFCLDILRQYFQKIDIDPSFMMGNDMQLTIMKKETLDEVFELSYAEAKNSKSSGFIELVEKYTGNRNDQALKDSVEKFYNFLSSQSDPVAWCEKVMRFFNSDEESLWSSLWGEEIKKIFSTQLEGALAYSMKAEEACLNSEGFEKTYDQMLKEREKIAKLQTLCEKDMKKGLDSLNETVKTYERFKGNTKADKALSDSIRDDRNRAKKIMQELQKSFANDLKNTLKELNDLGASMEEFVALTFRFRDAFREKKTKKNLVDFNDTERMALKILTDPEIKKEVREKYRYIFLDEYQDTNEMQEAILQKILRPDNYFMVGDVKQSIYRFRSGDPSIFIEKYHAFSNPDTLENTLVNLNQNFRSAQGVIDSVNAIFKNIMSVDLGEIDYDQHAMLNKGLPKDGPYEKTEIHLINASQETPVFEEEDSDTQVEKEARFIAKKIQTLIGSPIFDTVKNKTRPIIYGDFGVLMRSVRKEGSVYQKIFTEAGIPCYFDGGAHYYESLEIKIMINLLTLIDNPHQDLPLLSIMNAPIGGFSTRECTQLRIETPHGFYYQSVENHRDTGDDFLAEKLKDFYQKLDSWREESKFMPIEDFLWKLYLESGYYHFVGALPGGVQRQANLRILLKRAGDYKKTTLKGLFQFIRFIENMKNFKQDIPQATMLSSSDAVVRIMTIHKSKGLEFPIVFLAGTGKRFNKRENSDQILFHKNLGICPNYVNLEKRFKRDSLAKEVCKSRNNIEMLSEEMRLLYVAMTRAEEKLYIVASVKELKKRDWSQPLDHYHLLKATAFIDWIMLGILEGKSFRESFLECDHFKLYAHHSLSEEKEKKEENKKEHIIEETLIESGDPKKKSAVFRRLNYRYPQKIDNDLPSKMSVTEIKNRGKSLLKKMPDLVQKPKFLEKTSQDFTSAQRGSALHLLMESADLKPLQDYLLENGNENFTDFLKSYYKKETERLIKEEFLPPILLKSLDISRVVSFYASSLGQRLLASPKIKREIPFNYAYDPASVRKQWAESKDKIMVQGIIDCAFIEEGEWILIDYKTDYYRNHQEKEALIKNYKIQIDLYAEALENLSKIPVKEKILSLITMKENVLLTKIC